MAIPLEDNFTDIVGKVLRGRKLTDEQAAQQAGVTVAELASVRSGQPDEPVLRKIAPVLGLGADALAASARQAWVPRDPGPIPGLAYFNTPYQDMMVNAYLVYDPASKAAAAFDTGADCDGMLALIQQESLKLESIFLTHIHGDHILELDRLRETTGAVVWVSQREPISGADPFADGRQFTVGSLSVETRQTSGHSRGGVTYIVTGLARRLAIVGDALFAGSMGGGLVDFNEALRTNCEQLLTLPDDTVVCPGHGPLTTIGEEKQHNPFYTK